MLLLAIALWGMTIAPTKWAMESFPPLTLTFLRLFVASLLFLPFAWRKARKEAGSELVIPWRRMYSLSFTGVAGYFLFNYLGVAQTSGLHASIISALLPLCTMLMAAFYLKERMGATQWLGLLTGLAGVLLVTAQPSCRRRRELVGRPALFDQLSDLGHLRDPTEAAQRRGAPAQRIVYSFDLGHRGRHDFPIYAG